MFLNGENFSKISKRYNVTPRAIQLQLNKMGHHARYRGKIDPSIRPDIVSHYRTGNFTFKELAKKFNIGATAMRSLLNKEGCFAPCASDISRKYKINHHFFKTLDSPNKAYILGLLYADGCVHRPSNKISISLKQEDKHILEDINTLLETDKPLYFNKPKTSKNKQGRTINNHGQYIISIISKEMIHDLEKLGLNERKSLNLTWPSFIHNDLISHFIRGFFDGDGGISKDGKVSFMANLDFIENLKTLLINKLGISPNKIQKHSVSNVYYFRFGSKKDITALYTFLYNKDSTLFLKRKKDIFEKFIIRL
jgi:hypothetical protein